MTTAINGNLTTIANFPSSGYGASFGTSLAPYVLPFSEEWVILSTIIVVIFFLFGVTANTITAVVIHTSTKLTFQYYTFIQSLCVADVVSAFVSILFLYRRTWGFDYFALPDLFCRLYWGLDLWTSFSTALHIMSFAILRLVGVCWPIKFQLISTTHVKMWIASIWSITFIGGFFPHFLFNTAKKIDRTNHPELARWASCSLSPYWFSTWQVYVQFAYGFFLYLPAVSILCISAIIAAILKKRSLLHAEGNAVNQTSDSQKTTAKLNKASTSSNKAKKGNKNARNEASLRRWKKDKQVICQLFLIVGSFLFGYVPLTAFHFYTGFTIDQSNPEINAFDWKFAMVQYFMLRFSECLNPIFYNAASRRMREETIQLLKQTCPILTRKAANPNARTSGSEVLSTCV